jgi:hypothetical protein
LWLPKKDSRPNGWTNQSTGLLINCNNTKLKNGIKRFVLGSLRALGVFRGNCRRLAW